MSFNNKKRFKVGKKYSKTSGSTKFVVERLSLSKFAFHQYDGDKIIDEWEDEEGNEYTIASFVFEYSGVRVKITPDDEV